MSEQSHRVVALMSVTAEEVKIFGHGVYLGDFTPTEEEAKLHPNLEFVRMVGAENPKIQLDDGNIVWGAECYWGPEEGFDNWLDARKLTTVNIVEARADSEKLRNSEENGATLE